MKGEGHGFVASSNDRALYSLREVVLVVVLGVRLWTCALKLSDFIQIE